MIKVGIISGSTRPGRLNEQVVRWVFQGAQAHGGAEYELVDIQSFQLPLLDEPVPPSLGRYSKPHTLAWAAKIRSLDAFVFVTPEYNHGTSAALKNAIDFLFAEWNDKAAGFVSYGSAGGTRAVEHLRGIMAEIKIADVRQQVMFTLVDDFEQYRTFKPRPHHSAHLDTLLDQVIAWGTALGTVRAK